MTGLFPIPLALALAIPLLFGLGCGSGTSSAGSGGSGGSAAGTGGAGGRAGGSGGSAAGTGGAGGRAGGSGGSAAGGGGAGTGGAGTGGSGTGGAGTGGAGTGGAGTGGAGTGGVGTGGAGTGGAGTGGAGTGGAGTGGAGTGGGVGTALTTPDFPAASPCPSQALLTDATMFTALKTALLMGVVTYMDVPYNGADPNIFGKKCGLEGAFDPAIYVNPIPAGLPDLSTIVDTGNGGICATGFTAASFGTGEGFAAAGSYRKEFRVAYMATTYRIRARMVVSGSSAGHTFSQDAVAFPGGTASLVYQVNGATVPENALWGGLVTAMTAAAGSLPTATLTVRKTAADPEIFRADISLICAATM